MGKETVDDLLSDVRRTLERARSDPSVPTGDAAVERAWAIGHMEILLGRLQEGFVAPKIVRGPEAWPRHLEMPARMEIDPRNSGPEDYEGLAPADSYYIESGKLEYRYMKLDASCERCIDFLRMCESRCPHCGHSLERFLGRFHL